MRLTDIYYTDQVLDGNPVPPPSKPSPISFYQGDDIVLEVYLNYNGNPVNTTDWELQAQVKTTSYAKQTTWVGTLNDGLYAEDKEGLFKIIIPSDETAKLIAGTYWLAVAVKEKNGTGVRDITATIMKQPFSLEYSPMSPSPNPDRQGLEKTFPPSVDISKM